MGSSRPPVPPPRRPPNEPDPRKHLIADYSHREQQVTCVCGWVGSSQSSDGRTSNWSRHVAEGKASGG